MSSGGPFSKPRQPSMPDIPPPAPPPDFPTPGDKANLEQRKLQEQRALAAMKGRQSTILTSGDLGTPALATRPVLGS